MAFAGALGCTSSSFAGWKRTTVFTGDDFFLGVKFCNCRLRKLRGNVAPLENFRQLFDQARVTAGITEWPDNALRHSFASYHLAHFKDAKALALEMGHTDSGMLFNHYRALVRPNDAERYWNIGPARTANVLPTDEAKQSEPVAKAAAL